MHFRTRPFSDVSLYTHAHLETTATSHTNLLHATATNTIATGRAGAGGASAAAAVRAGFVADVHDGDARSVVVTVDRVAGAAEAGTRVLACMELASSLL